MSRHNPCDECETGDCNNCEFNLLRTDYEDLEMQMIDLHKKLDKCQKIATILSPNCKLEFDQLNEQDA